MKIVKPDDHFMVFSFYPAFVVVYTIWFIRLVVAYRRAKRAEAQR